MDDPASDTSSFNLEVELQKLRPRRTPQRNYPDVSYYSKTADIGINNNSNNNNFMTKPTTTSTDGMYSMNNLAAVAAADKDQQQRRLTNQMILAKIQELETNLQTITRDRQLKHETMKREYEVLLMKYRPSQLLYGSSSRSGRNIFAQPSYYNAGNFYQETNRGNSGQTTTTTGVNTILTGPVKLASASNEKFTSEREQHPHQQQSNFNNNGDMIYTPRDAFQTINYEDPFVPGGSPARRHHASSDQNNLDVNQETNNNNNNNNIVVLSDWNKMTVTRSSNNTNLVSLVLPPPVFATSSSSEPEQEFGGGFKDDFFCGTKPGTTVTTMDSIISSSRLVLEASKTFGNAPATTLTSATTFSAFGNQGAEKEETDGSVLQTNNNGIGLTSKEQQEQQQQMKHELKNNEKDKLIHKYYKKEELDDEIKFLSSSQRARQFLDLSTTTTTTATTTTAGATEYGDELKRVATAGEKSKFPKAVVKTSASDDDETTTADEITSISGIAPKNNLFRPSAAAVQEHNLSPSEEEEEEEDSEPTSSSSSSPSTVTTTSRDDLLNHPRKPTVTLPSASAAPTNNSLAPNQPNLLQVTKLEPGTRTRTTGASVHNNASSLEIADGPGSQTMNEIIYGVNEQGQEVIEEPDDENTQTSFGGESLLLDSSITGANNKTPDSLPKDDSELVHIQEVTEGEDEDGESAAEDAYDNNDAVEQEVSFAEDEGESGVNKLQRQEQEKEVNSSQFTKESPAAAAASAAVALGKVRMADNNSEEKASIINKAWSVERMPSTEMRKEKDFQTLQELTAENPDGREVSIESTSGKSSFFDINDDDENRNGAKIGGNDDNRINEKYSQRERQENAEKKSTVPDFFFGEQESDADEEDAQKAPAVAVVPENNSGNKSVSRQLRRIKLDYEDSEESEFSEPVVGQQKKPAAVIDDFESKKIVDNTETSTGIRSNQQPEEPGSAAEESNYNAPSTTDRRQPLGGSVSGLGNAAIEEPGQTNTAKDIITEDDLTRMVETDFDDFFDM